MQTHNHTTPPPNREAKKAIVLDAPKKSPVPTIITIAFTLALTAGVGLYLVSPQPAPSNPAPLKRSIEGDRVVIQIDDIRKGATYFNFSAEA